MNLAPDHSQDSDCTLNADGQCVVCGVSHGDPCPLCGGRGFHTSENCPELFDRDSAEYRSATEAIERLKVYTENNDNIRFRRVGPTLKKLISQKERGTYRRDEALDDFRYVAEGGAKNYGQEFGVDWKALFPKNVRDLVALAWLKEFESEWSP